MVTLDATTLTRVAQMKDRRPPPITLKTAVGGLVLFGFSGSNLCRWYSTGNFYASHNGEVAINFHNHPGFFIFLATVYTGTFLIIGIGLLAALYRALADADQAE